MSELIKKTVEEWVREARYFDDPEYVPSKFSMEFVTFIKLVNGANGEENLTPVVHYRMLDKVAGKTRNTINMCHRGLAKTTLLGEYLFLYIAVYGKLPGFGDVKYALYIGDSIENGVKKMRKNLEYRWENSEFLQQYVPKISFTDIRWEFTNADGNKFIVSGHGAKTGVRGTKELGTRPVLAVMDDLVSDEDARSPTVIESIEATVTKAIRYALHPTRFKQIWSGTPFNSKDPLYKAVESGAWHVNVYPVCETYPCTRAEFRGSWPDRFTYDYVKEMYDTASLEGKLASFNQELMLTIMSEDERLIKDDEICWYNLTDVIRRKNEYNFYITTDFAITEDEDNDYSVISVWALNSQGYWFWVDGVCIRQTMDKNFDDLFMLVQRYKPLGVGVEVSGQQGGFISLLKKEMGDRNCYFTLSSEGNKGKEGIRPSNKTKKLERFQSAVPLFKTKRIMFPRQKRDSVPMIEAVSELSLVCGKGFKSKHDDFCDTIAMLMLIPSYRPAGNDYDMEQDDNGIWGMPEDVQISAYSSYTV